MQTTYERYEALARAENDGFELFIKSRFDVFMPAVEKEGVNVHVLEDAMDIFWRVPDDEEPLTWFFREVVPLGDARLFWDGVADMLDGYERRHNPGEPILSTRVRSRREDDEMAA